MSDTSLDEWLDDLVRRWAWWLRRAFGYQGYPAGIYEGYTVDYLDEWTEGYANEDEVGPKAIKGFSKLLCDSYEETIKFEYRNDDTCN